jgi:capsular exopolysaccharide synthesis family protein
VSSTPASAGRQPDLAMLSQPTSPMAEAFRALRANLKFAGGEHPPRAILLADTGTGEGRALVAANLAVALAQAGDTTLLIDADLRQSRQHELFGVSNASGVSTFLRGEGESLPIVATAVPNLSLLPAGPTPPNPAELLAGARSPIMLARAREAATFVILDAPPLSAIADALALGTIADGVLLVIRAGKTRRPAAQRVKDQLERVGANILGVILTDAPTERGTYKY